MGDYRRRSAAGYTGGMALERAIVGALTHAELVDVVVRQSVLIEQLQATVVEQQALIGGLEARIRELEAQRDRDDPTPPDDAGAFHQGG